MILSEIPKFFPTVNASISKFAFYLFPLLSCKCTWQGILSGCSSSCLPNPQSSNFFFWLFGRPSAKSTNLFYHIPFRFTVYSVSSSNFFYVSRAIFLLLLLDLIIVNLMINLGFSQMVNLVIFIMLPASFVFLIAALGPSRFIYFLKSFWVVFSPPLRIAIFAKSARSDWFFLVTFGAIY